MASERPGVSGLLRRRTCHSNRPLRRMNGRKLPNREKGVPHGWYATYVGERARLAVYPGYSFGARTDIDKIAYVRMYVIGAPAVNNEPDMFALVPQAACMPIAVAF
eukprot:6212573-Pleurochrysis_carterae.AAC.2